MFSSDGDCKDRCRVCGSVPVVLKGEADTAYKCPRGHYTVIEKTQSECRRKWALLNPEI